jgi:hypothetical protein
MVILTVLSGLCMAIPSAAQDYQGFGAATQGGQGKPLYHVTNLNDSGPGSLRDALAQGNRYIRFEVAGEILLQSRLYIRGANVTVDGFTAPSPGITLKNYGPFIHGSNGAHDIIVRGIRVRNTVQDRDGIQVAYGAYNVVIDHVSVQGGGDGNLDITEDSHDVTVSWSILAKPAGTEKNMLIKYNPSRITLHHNIFLNAMQRNPQVRIDDAGTPAKETTIDMRNNLVWGWAGGYGTLIWYGPWANVVDNFYSAAGGDPTRALEVSNGARAYVADNISNDGLTNHINAMGTQGVPFPAPLVDTTDACTAALMAFTDAGVRPLDAVDTQHLSAIALPSCATPIPPPPTNHSPAVNAGPDIVITLPASATLDGTVTDDGLPKPLGTVATTWTKLSGPSGTVTFANASAIDTTASFTAAGTYVLRLTASDGALSSSDDVTVVVNPAPTGQAVVSFTLINADTDQPIASFNPLNSGVSLNLATLGTRNLNIRANTSPATVGSVRFGFDGTASYRTESGAPYSLAGDNNGNYSAWQPRVGLHTVTATPYTRSNARGTVGKALTITFNVIDNPN